MSGLIDKAKDYVTDKVANMKKPEATVKNVDLKNIACDCITYNAEVIVSNPYSTSIPICEIAYTFKSADRVIAEGKIPDPGSLKGNADTKLDVGLKVPHNVLVSLIKDIGADWDIDYEVNIVLIVDLPVLGDISIPVNNKGEIKLPTLSSLFGYGSASDDSAK
ncbi:late embryogenesis abundant protein Lea14-A-like [Cynara cardunculus var. scolymus]|uniref:Immunoglobulin-like fold n=1 Tax=Cynara cardunculus var. scolymus TaxID=59895 RepID=A0A103XUU0_CYNCS|nr:late embryogenesis abundant protein Lea14-A-like [Cynara cardunculus var. scolymus]KVH97245.1 Immunoglobulin-like fold [Cynara cardunculus var. scolymus]